MRTLLAVGLILVGVGIVVGTFLYLRSIPDDLTERLKAAPGYDLTLPNADELWDTVGESVGGAGTSRTRVWGVRGSPEDVARFTDTALSGLGYEKVGGPGIAGGKDGDLGQYRRADVRFTVMWVGLPHRVPGGRFIVSGYDFIVYTTIENGERAKLDS